MRPQIMFGSVRARKVQYGGVRSWGVMAVFTDFEVSVIKKCGLQLFAGTFI